MTHAQKASEFIKDQLRTKWHDETLWMVRSKRDRAVEQVKEWEQLRQLASDIKDHTLSRLDHYLTEFETRALENGIKVSWAKDATEHNQLVYEILRKRKINRVVKSKSILTEECHLNPFLESRGIEVVDTDLGERIVQFAKQPPSHIVLPAIHLKKKEISTIFQQEIGTEPGNEDPEYLTRAARKHLREKFLNADAALTGVNFGIAETGGFVICTNEGNADMGVHLAPVHIASMGIEKLIPQAEHLGVFIRLLARSGTGQSITTYTSHFHAPGKGQEIHLILVDNGRTTQLGREKFRSSLKCIRCGACMNTCPIYRRSGGYSYQATVPGPIGSILSPGVDLEKYSSLPFASTLCGSCTDVCPVRINIHEQLYQWRQEIVRAGKASWSEIILMRITGQILRRPVVYKIVSQLVRLIPSGLIEFFAGRWMRQREIPVLPPSTFKEWFRKNRPSQ